jgi:hypothetical protein
MRKHINAKTLVSLKALCDVRKHINAKTLASLKALCVMSENIQCLIKVGRC